MPLKGTPQASSPGGESSELRRPWRCSICRVTPSLWRSSMASSHRKQYKFYPPNFIKSCITSFRHPVRLTVWKQSQPEAKEEKLLLLHVRVTYHNVGNVPHTCRCLVIRQPFVHFPRSSVSFRDDCQSDSATRKTLRLLGLFLDPQRTGTVW